MATNPSLPFYTRPHRGAQLSPRMTGIYRTNQSATSVNISDGAELERVINDFTRNIPWVESFLSSWVFHTVGTGIWPYFAASDEIERKALRQWFRRWITETDADGMTTLHGQTALVSRMVAKDGEVFARFRPRRLTDGLSTPLQIQLIPAVMVSRSKTEVLSNGNTIIGGIERNSLGRRVAYHVYREHPGDPHPSGRITFPDTARIPASQMLHIGLPQDVGELRHISKLRSTLLTMKGMGDTNDNTMERLRVASLITGFYSNALDENEAPQQFGEGEPDSHGVADTYYFEPGGINELPPGATMFFPEAPDVGTAYIDFMTNQLENIAATLGIPFSELSGNYSKTNFSSLRAAIVHNRRGHDQFRQLVLIDQFLAPVIKSGLRTAVLAGAIDLPGYADDPTEYDQIKWRGQRHEYLDPQTEATADAQRLESQTVALSDLVNGDFEEHCRQLADDADTLRRYGLAGAIAAATAGQVLPSENRAAEEQETEDE